MKNSFSALIGGLTVTVLLTACGGGSPESPVVSKVQTTTVPVLGAVYGASVFVYSTAGQLLSSGKTDAVTGKAALSMSAEVAGPFIYKVVLSGGSRYYDEGLDAVVTVAPTESLTLLSLATSTSGEVGVTALSNMAVRLAGVYPEMLGTSATSGLSLDKLSEAVATVIAVLGLPADFDLFAAPVAASPNNKNPASVYGKLLAQMAINAGPGNNAFTQAASLAQAINNQGVVASAQTLVDLNQALQASAAAMGMSISDAQALINDPALLAQQVALIRPTVQANLAPHVVVTAPVVPHAGGSASATGGGTSTFN
ncbi:hypothetical protein B9Z51_06475 [Limnohabitans sp. T6-5]|uniref:hypothetical protein n=1 Tax=Limnohabitans sp. T6-5 TaxID=1100724 RepID=UPI000D3B3588|nr:hypothetical protein [Limnohabitans sp. T6-5]PUE08596.1 hypothetical protein B9Z51_06475 [Limnohabitans sp. T6-5]